MTPAPRPARAMPVHWALVFAVVCAVAAGGMTYVVDDWARDRAPPERCFIDSVLMPIDGEVYSIRWLEGGIPRMVQVEGAEACARVVNWLRR